MYRERGFTNSNPYYRGRTHRATYELTSSIPEGHLGSRTDDDLDLAPGYRRWTYTYGEIVPNLRSRRSSWKVAGGEYYSAEKTSTDPRGTPPTGKKDLPIWSAKPRIQNADVFLPPSIPKLDSSY
ncbi:hypothetical protein LSH36_232g01004 [Paralvinella palmiformis]|uniref:Uncharacterized protein n=1 Tax=Paralvinella palmiformis TaxID=53620 RepID=A0AAD9JNM1_9ANNE|nr:hypothetical protein LSH36_232g01004 [Paralvinella palmiformis]